MKSLKFFLVLLIMLAPINSLTAAETLLTDELVLEKLAGFEQAIKEKKIDFFQDNFGPDSRITVHSKQRSSKYAVEFSKQEILEGKLFEGPNVLNKLERISTDISYYNVDTENAQALLTYKMAPKKESDFRKGYLAEVQMLYQVMHGKVEIVKIIVHIDLEPNYQPLSN